MSNAQGSPHTVNLTGNGVTTAPAVSLTCTSGGVTVACNPLTFSAQAVGTPSTAQNVILTNIGNAALIITRIVPTGDFLETDTCGTGLAAGAGCTINVTFKPTTTGTRAGALTINDNTG